MAQRKIFVVAFTLTIGFGGLVFALASGVSPVLAQQFQQRNCTTPAYYDDHRADCNRANRRPASPSPSPLPSPAPSPATSTAPSPTASVAPSPSGSISPVPIGTPFRIRQSRWATVSGSIDAIAVNKVENEDEEDKSCGDEENDKVRTVIWNKYMVRNNVKFSSKYNDIIGMLSEEHPLGNAYIISSVFTTDNADTTKWEELNLVFRYRYANSLTLYYRVSDDGGTKDAKDKGWIKLQNPISFKDKASCTKAFLAQYKLDRTAKYFQYKVHVNTPISIRNPRQEVKNISIKGQPLKKAVETPNPNASVTPSATPTNVGRITIETRKIVYSTSTQASASPVPSGPPLPDLTPAPGTSPSPKKTSPQPTASASVGPTSSPTFKPTANPICFADNDTDPAPSVQIGLRQTNGGSLVIEDQVTNEDGQWRGTEEELSYFDEGTYVVNFKPFEKNDYKLVALCVEPDDGEHYVKTQTSVSGGKATILVRPGQETKVVALYAPRSKPYISMSTFAVDTNNRIIKSIAPGQSMRFLIRYENTGESDAKNVSIQDVIPEQFYVPDTEKEFLDDKNQQFTTNIDALGRTLITKKIDVLKKGQKGSITIPVILRADAFGTPDDITNAVQQSKREAAGQAEEESSTSSPDAQGGAGGGTDGGDFTLD